jgi:hypothetical protein
MTKNWQLLFAASLAILMIITRSNYFDWATVLPSASLAIFFLVGFYLRSYLSFSIFAGLAYACDYWVLIVGGEGCFTSAYEFIFAGYFLVWRCAKWAAERYVLTRLQDGIKLVAVALLSISGAFLISNGSFYAFSGNFSDLSLVDYSARVARYYFTYLTDPLIYLAIGALIHRVVDRLAQRLQTTNVETSE